MDKGITQCAVDPRPQLSSVSPSPPRLLASPSRLLASCADHRSDPCSALHSADGDGIITNDEKLLHLDKDGDGIVTKEEEDFHEMDVDGDGIVSYKEFHALQTANLWNGELESG